MNGSKCKDSFVKAEDGTNESKCSGSRWNITIIQWKQWATFHVAMASLFKFYNIYRKHHLLIILLTPQILHGALAKLTAIIIFPWNFTYLWQRFRWFAVNASDFCDIWQVWSGICDGHMSVLKDKTDILHHVKYVWHWRTQISLHQELQRPSYEHRVHHLYSCHVHRIQDSIQKSHVVTEGSSKEWCHWEGHGTAPMCHWPHIKCYSVDVNEGSMEVKSQSNSAFGKSAIKYDKIIGAPRIHQLVCFGVWKYCITWLESSRISVLFNPLKHKYQVANSSSRSQHSGSTA